MFGILRVVLTGFAAFALVGSVRAANQVSGSGDESYDEADHQSDDGELPTREPSADEASPGRSPFAYPQAPTLRRNTFWPSLFSLLLPGLDQWTESQYAYAAAYSGVALFGIGYASANSRPNDEDRIEDPNSIEARRIAPDELERKRQWGGQLTLLSGSFSAYQAFRSAVRTQQPYGRFGFLTKEETPGQILAAPLHFSYLKRWTTIVPLALIGGVYLIGTNVPNNTHEHDPLSDSDALFTGLLSTGAGTGEEALFRGWIMPEFMDAWGSPFWSNTATSTIFALAHLGSVSVPLPQFLLGFYLGYITQQSDWTIAESVFIHTWWDVFAFAYLFQTREKLSKSAALTPLLVPLFETVF